MKQDEVDKLEFLKPREEHLRELIIGTEREIVNCEVQEAVYLSEAVNPKNMGKDAAEAALGEYKKRIRTLKEFLWIYKDYAKAREFKI